MKPEKCNFIHNTIASIIPFASLIASFITPKVLKVVVAISTALAIALAISSMLFGTSAKDYNLSEFNQLWYEQLPVDDVYKFTETGGHQNPLSQESILSQIFESRAKLTDTANDVLEINEKLIKQTVARVDITNLGVTDYIINKIMERHKTEYIISAQGLNNSTPIQQRVGEMCTFEISAGETCTFDLYRNLVQLNFDITDHRANLEQPYGLVMTCSTDPSIASIVHNTITANAVGETNIQIVYGLNLLEVSVIVVS